MNRKCKYALFVGMILCVFTVMVCTTGLYTTTVHAENNTNTVYESDMNQPSNHDKILYPVHKVYAQNNSITITIGSIMYHDYTEEGILYCYCKYNITTINMTSQNNQNQVIMNYQE